jgi:hypothetical protein
MPEILSFYQPVQYDKSTEKKNILHKVLTYMLYEDEKVDRFLIQISS